LLTIFVQGRVYNIVFSNKKNSIAMPSPALEEYQISWIYALPIEAATAEEMLDENFETLKEQDNADTNVYTLG
jgi:hypothetical protein